MTSSLSDCHHLPSSGPTCAQLPTSTCMNLFPLVFPGTVLAEACFNYSSVCFLGAVPSSTGEYEGPAWPLVLAAAPGHEFHCPSSSGPVCLTQIVFSHPSCPNVSQVASKSRASYGPATCPWEVPSSPNLSFPDGEFG